MKTDGQLLKEIVTQAQQLSAEDRLRLIQRVVETLIPCVEPTRPHRPLVYGQFRGERMSTDDDFLIAEWGSTERDLNGL